MTEVEDRLSSRIDALETFASRMEIGDATTDAKIAAAEARLRGESNEKFADMRGEMKLMNADISHKLDIVLSKIEAFDVRLSGFDARLSGFDVRLSEQRIDLDKKLADQRSDLKADFRASRNLMIGLAVSLAGLMLAIVIAVFSVGGTMFSRGMQIRDIVKAVHAEEQAKTPAPAKP